jgi:hypothetical protein
MRDALVFLQDSAANYHPSDTYWCNSYGCELCTARIEIKHTSTYKKYVCPPEDFGIKNTSTRSANSSK